MFVFKLSWFPYMLILAGIVLAADGQPAALTMTAGGIAWLYFSYKSKQSNTPTSSSAGAPVAPPVGAPTATPGAAPTVTPNETVSSPDPGVPVSPIAVPVTAYPAPEETPAPPKANTVQFCGSCGAKVTPGSAFCGSCGAKLH